MVPASYDPRGSVNSARAGCAERPHPLTVSVTFEIHSQLAPPSLLSKIGKKPGLWPESEVVARSVPSSSSVKRGYVTLSLSDGWYIVLFTKKPKGSG